MLGTLPFVMAPGLGLSAYLTYSLFVPLSAR
jgi:xanthine/uracil/vitamin C permease (AzgA family)